MLFRIFIKDLNLETATVGAQNPFGFPIDLSGHQDRISPLTLRVSKADDNPHFAQSLDPRGESRRIIGCLVVDRHRLVSRFWNQRYQVLDFALTLSKLKSLPFSVINRSCTSSLRVIPYPSNQLKYCPFTTV